ncbi:leucine-rich repeat-containing protein kinase family protein [Janthinobacterium psychrotolerans]|uniref:Leucine rich repeat-containing protein n=1 Tax=Janthinobacterium psychrotolerans TaxID=1747903 RepID=A0A1A7C605_9BURK|nr:leucine-rich repeat-containing protein kinase family protein [Janthinobacterium psychrotolerans]OBV41142.1 Leucine rich repeat-containing protein [Janthinobacterium psychrotolerans]
MSTTLEQLRAGQLAGAQRLSLSCGLTSFPPEIFDLADSLEILDLTGNALSSLPDDLPRLRKLRIVFCSSNLFTVLPAVLGSCPELSMIGFKANQIHEVPAAALPPKLRWLTLTDNAIENLPDEIGDCALLQKLMLAGNRLQSLPASLARCSRLELLRISANRLPSLPVWLQDLSRLSWLACAGNPFNEAREAAAFDAAGIEQIDWNRLQLGRQLGEGASGVISQATLEGRPVAVKVFKGAMTSDGLPRSEMAACVSAGAHASMIPILGTVSAHPQGSSCLVMPLIDPAYINLAGPPSFASCTRDVYQEDARFTLPQVQAIAHAIASAACQLHACGILHGDLYAHNILHHPDGRCLLGDFGGASLYAPDAAVAGVMQGIEVRAFGVLLAELLARCDTAAPALGELVSACLLEQPLQRPRFAQIAALIAA